MMHDAWDYAVARMVYNIGVTALEIAAVIGAFGAVYAYIRFIEWRRSR